MKTHYQSAVLFTRNLVASRHFYQDLLSQEVGQDFGANLGFKAGFALWELKSAEANIGDTLKPNSGELYFETDNPKALLARLQRAGVEVLHPLREQPWGQQVFRVLDPSGHMVEIGEPMTAVVERFLQKGMSLEQIAQRTLLSLEAVKEIAEPLLSSLV
jgi:catechol 2,3-dioxygenase-like lactoylglutathione lyase family enzyme